MHGAPCKFLLGEADADPLTTTPESLKCLFVFLNRELSFAYLERQQQRIHFHISIQLDSHTQERPAGSISSLLSLISHPASDFYFPFQLKSTVQQIPPDIRKMACLALCLRAPVQVKGRTSGRFTEGKETMGP